MTNTQIALVGLVLNHQNWTGLSLRELVDAGRIQADDRKVIFEFTKAALGEPLSMDEWKKKKEIADLATLALRGFAMKTTKPATA